MCNNNKSVTSNNGFVINMINFSVIGTLAYWLFSQIACWAAQVNGRATVL